MQRSDVFHANAIAIDPSNNVFLLTTSSATYDDSDGNPQSYSTAQYCTLNSSGVMISPPGGYNLGGSQTQSLSLYNLAIAGDSTAYIPSTTLLGRTLNGVATDGSGYVAGNAPYTLPTPSTDPELLADLASYERRGEAFSCWHAPSHLPMASLVAACLFLPISRSITAAMSGSSTRKPVIRTPAPHFPSYPPRAPHSSSALASRPARKSPTPLP